MHKNKKHLLFISSEFFIDVDLTLLKELVNYFSVEWYLLHQKNARYFDLDSLKRYSDQHNIRLNIFINQNRYRSIKTFIFYWHVLWRAKKTNSDIIYTETLGYPYLPFLLFLFFPIDKIFIGIHDFLFLYGENKRTIKVICSKFTFHLYNNFHFFSKSQEKHFLLKYPKKNTFSTPLSLKDFGQPLGKFQFNLDKSKINILFFGRITKYKGLDTFLNEFNILDESLRSIFHITIWGDCSDFQIYQDLIKYPENFTIKIEQVPNEVIPDLFSQHDLLILPYKDVTQSGVLFIALNYSLPIICPDHESFREILGSENSFIFFNPQIDGDLSRVLAKIAMKGDPYIQQLRKNIRENVRGFYLPSLNAKVMANYIEKTCK